MYIFDASGLQTCRRVIINNNINTVYYSTKK